jgi:hypothetical protein
VAVAAAFLSAQEALVPRAVVRAAEAVLLSNARAAVVEVYALLLLFLFQ